MSSHTTASRKRSHGQFIHPMRQTPSQHNTPLLRSRSTSISDDEADHQVLLNRSRVPSHPPIPPTQPYAPLPSVKRTPPPLHIRTHSSSRTIRSPSQTNLPETPSSLRNGELFATDRSARSSLESRARLANSTRQQQQQQQDNIDMVHVQALRSAYSARQHAKEQEEEAKRARALEKKEASRARSRAGSVKSSRSVPVGVIEYKDTMTSFPVDRGSASPKGRRSGTNMRSASVVGPDTGEHRPKRTLGRRVLSAGKYVAAKANAARFRAGTELLKLKGKVVPKRADVAGKSFV